MNAVAYLVPAAFVAAGLALFVFLAEQDWLPLTGPTWVHVAAAAPGLACFVLAGGNLLRGAR
jgi:hypothetical protein